MGESVAESLAAHDVFHIQTRIARVRSPEFTDGSAITGKEGFAVDEVICPEESLTTSIRKLIEYPEALQVLEFSQGQLSLIRARAVDGSALGRAANATARRCVRAAPSLPARGAAYCFGCV